MYLGLGQLGVSWLLFWVVMTTFATITVSLTSTNDIIEKVLKSSDTLPDVIKIGYSRSRGDSYFEESDFFKSIPDVSRIHPNESATLLWNVHDALHKLVPEGWRSFQGLDVSSMASVPFKTICSIHSGLESQCHYGDRATLKVSGDINISFSLSDVTEEDTKAGYSVSVNFEGVKYVTLSSSARIFIFGPPTSPLIVPHSGDTKENSTLVLTCSSNTTSVPSNLAPLLRYTWTRNNGSLPVRHSVSGDQMNILTIDPVTREDHDAEYECTVQEEGSRFSNKTQMRLSVSYPPGPASSLTAEIGPYYEGHQSHLVLECTLADPGNPAALYDWKKDGDIRATGVGPTFTIASGQLKFTDHNGNWTCTPWNKVGSGKSGTVNLKVAKQFAPIICMTVMLFGALIFGGGADLVWIWVKRRGREKLQVPVRKVSSACQTTAWLCVREKENVDLMSLVQEGSFLNIWDASPKNNSPLPEHFVVKKNSAPESGQQIAEHFLESQGQVLTQLFDHGCVLECLGKCSGMLLLESAPLGNLHKFLVAMTDNTYANTDLAKSTTSLTSFVHQVLEAASVVDKLAPEALHYSLSSKDVLLFDQHKVKLGNFGGSDEVRARERFEEENNLPRPYRWMAPETVVLKHCKKSDVWSLGVLIWEILNHGDQPLEDIDDEDIPRYIKKGRHPLMTDLMRPEQYRVLESCWRFLPFDRPDVDTVMTQMNKVIACESNMNIAVENAHNNAREKMQLKCHGFCTVK